MTRYEISNEFKNLGFVYHPSEGGSMEMYSFEDTQKDSRDRTIEVKMEAYTQSKSGKLETAACLVKVNGRVAISEYKDIPTEGFTGSYTEVLVVKYIEEKLRTLNILLDTSFHLEGDK